jgi:hypothetical protein
MNLESNFIFVCVLFNFFYWGFVVFIVEVIYIFVNEIGFLVSFSAVLLLVYEKATDF